MAPTVVASRLFRIALVCTTIHFSVCPLSAQEKAVTHAARPSELLAAIGHADKIVVYDSSPTISTDGGSPSPAVLYSSTNPKDISGLQQSIQMERPREWFRCACIPPIEIELSRNGREIGVISVYDDPTIGYSLWSGDVRLSNREKLVRWFDARGIDGPRRAMERQQAQDRSDDIAAARWLAAMPPNLRPLWPQVLKNPQWWEITTVAISQSAETLKPVLATEYPDVNQRIRSLFAWFGSGSGNWSGYYAWEDVPSHMLLQYAPSELIGALKERPLADAESEGAARFFVGYSPGSLFRLRGDTTLIKQVPDDLKESLLEYVERTGNQDKIQEFKKAFSIP